MNAIDLFRRLRTGDIGFRMTEDMTGWHEYLPGRGPAGVQPFSFRVDWGTDRVKDCVAHDGGLHFVQSLAGTVTVGGLCDATPCRGSLDLRYLADRRLVYDFTFTVGETTYRWVGQKVNVRPWNLPVSHTTCFGTLTDATSGRLVSRGVVLFRLATVPAFVMSIRPVFQPA
jgi:hypothetical protein